MKTLNFNRQTGHVIDKIVNRYVENGYRVRFVNKPKWELFKLRGWEPGVDGKSEVRVGAVDSDGEMALMVKKAEPPKTEPAKPAEPAAKKAPPVAGGFK